MQDLSSLTRDPTRDLAVKAPSPNHWTARKFLISKFLKDNICNAFCSVLVSINCVNVSGPATGATAGDRHGGDGGSSGVGGLTKDKSKPK